MYYACLMNYSTTCTGTHDIQNISVSSPLPGQVRVTGDFIEGSTATGVLGIIVNVDHFEIRYHNVIMVPKVNVTVTVLGMHVEGVISGLAGGQYRISLFVVEENGLPFNRVATRPSRVISVEHSK